MGKYEKAELFLSEVQRALNDVTPDLAIAPDRDAPKLGVLVGTTTPYQRALEAVLQTTGDIHSKMHEEAGLDFGAHKDLPIEHQKIHAMLGIVNHLLNDDLTNEFGNGEESYYVFDRNWNVYRVKPTLFDRIASAWRHLKSP